MNNLLLNSRQWEAKKTFRSRFFDQTFWDWLQRYQLWRHGHWFYV